MFSKSKTKRFQDPVSCGPAPGQYDVKDIKSSAKAVVFEKDQRWKNSNDDSGVLGYSSMENLSDSNNRKSLLPLCQSTCLRKPMNSKRRKSQFVSSSATDLTSRLSMEADTAELNDTIRQLQAKIMQLEAEIVKLKQSKIDNSELSVNMDELVNEKLNAELEKQRLEESLRLLKSEELSRTEVTSNAIIQLEVSFTNVYEGLFDKYNVLESKFVEVLTGYHQRLEKAKILLGKIHYVNQLEKEKNEALVKNYELLVTEKNKKEELVVIQEEKLVQYASNVNNLMDQLKSKEETCDGLNTQLIDVNKEKEEKVKSFSKEKERILEQIAGLESLHEKELDDIKCSLLISEDMNIEYKRQIENIESSFTQNIREMTGKYECLEETFEKTQRYYEERLNRANSLVQKTSQARKKSNEEFENLQRMYTEQQFDYSQLSKDYVLLEEELEKAKQINVEHTDHIQSLTNNIKEKDANILDFENDVKLLTNQLAISEKNLEAHQDNESLLCIQLKEKDQKLNEYEESDKTKTKELNSKNEEIKEYENVIQKLKSELSYKSDELVELKDNVSILSIKLSEKEVLVEEYETKMDTMILESNKKQQTIDKHEDDIQALTYQLQSFEKTQISEEELSALQNKLLEMENECDEWKSKYEELEVKVGPFMDQIEQFSLEKRSLLNQNSLTQQELKKLSDKYAEMLGHQNNKQKIRHISKLKDENLQLKTEVMKLRSAESKDKAKIKNLESKLHDGKRFDSTKSFCHSGKENRDALRSVNH